MKRPLLLFPLLALALLAASCRDPVAGRASDDDPALAQARAILAECRPGAEPPPPGSASRSTVVEFRCGDSSFWEGVPIEGRALNTLGLLSCGKPADPVDVALVRPYLAHTNADVRTAAILLLEDWFADLAVPFPAEDPSLPADLEAAAEARAAAPAPPLPDEEAEPALRHVAAGLRVAGPQPLPPFAVLTNDLGRLECWARPFIVDADDSSLRCVQELLCVRYDKRDAARAAPSAIRSRWLLAPVVAPDEASWHAAVGPRLDRLIPRTGGCVPGIFPVRLHPPATLAGGAAAPVRFADLPPYGGALDWEALAILEDDSAAPRRIVFDDASVPTNGFSFLSSIDLSFGLAAVDLALRPDPATPGGVVLSAAQSFEPDPQNVAPAFATNRILRAEVPLLPGQTALFGTRTDMVEVDDEDRVPVLSGIPLLGDLFTHRYTSTNASETLLLVRFTPATRSPEKEKSHAETAESAEPEPHAEGAEGGGPAISL